LQELADPQKTHWLMLIVELLFFSAVGLSFFDCTSLKFGTLFKAPSLKTGELGTQILPQLKHRSFAPSLNDLSTT
tara:strand:- start:1011 stop:1235 length:225 start_codon:yes stop_codon:yes gene_type:complete